MGVAFRVWSVNVIVVEVEVAVGISLEADVLVVAETVVGLGDATAVVEPNGEDVISRHGVGVREGYVVAGLGRVQNIVDVVVDGVAAVVGHDECVIVGLGLFGLFAGLFAGLYDGFAGLFAGLYDGFAGLFARLYDGLNGLDWLDGGLDWLDGFDGRLNRLGVGLLGYDCLSDLSDLLPDNTSLCSRYRIRPLLCSYRSRSDLGCSLCSRSLLCSYLSGSLCGCSLCCYLLCRSLCSRVLSRGILLSRGLGIRSADESSDEREIVEEVLPSGHGGSLSWCESAWCRGWLFSVLWLQAMYTGSLVNHEQEIATGSVLGRGCRRACCRSRS